MSEPAMEETLFFSGYAKLPAGITACEIYKVVGIGVEVDDLGNILDAECTLATDVGRRFFRQLVLGKNLDSGLSGIIQSVEKRYHGNAQKAIISTLKMIQEKYRVCKGNKASIEEKRNDLGL